MLCIEVTVNGERKYVAGHAQIESMRASLHITEEHPRLFIVNAYLKPGESFTEDAFWPCIEPKINDEIKIRIIECDSPDKPERLVTRGTKQFPNGEKTLYCSICGKSQEEASKLVASKDVNVCNECVDLLVEIINKA